MPQLIVQPTVVAAAGTKPKRIEEFVGRVSTGTPSLSIARMTSPAGWVERAKESSSEPGNGSAIRHPIPRARSTLPSACRRSLPTPCTAIPKRASNHDHSGRPRMESSSKQSRQRLCGVFQPIRADCRVRASKTGEYVG
jgi:hypothetical protein